ncbi:unnamed protein product, partial [Didymodactylos carnosus]
MRQRGYHLYDGSAWIAILIALIFFVIGFSWYYGQERLKNYMNVQSTTASLNDLPMRFGLRTQRLKSVSVADNQRFDIQNISDDDDSPPSPHNQVYSRISVLTNVPFSSSQNQIELHGLGEQISVSVTPGVGCFLTHNRRQTPHVFENHVQLLHSVPQVIIFLRIQYARVPVVVQDKRLLIKLYGNIYHISATFGYAEMKKKSVYKDILLLAKELYQLPIPEDEAKITFF